MNIRTLDKVYDRLTLLRSRYMSLTDIFKKYHAAIQTQLSTPPYESDGYIVSNYEDNGFTVTYLNKEIIFLFELHESEQGLYGHVSCYSRNKFEGNETSNIDNFTFNGAGKTDVKGLEDPIFLNQDDHLVNLTLGILEKAWN